MPQKELKFLKSKNRLGIAHGEGMGEDPPPKNAFPILVKNNTLYIP